MSLSSLDFFLLYSFPPPIYIHTQRDRPASAGNPPLQVSSVLCCGSSSSGADDTEVSEDETEGAVEVSMINNNGDGSCYGCMFLQCCSENIVMISNIIEMHSRCVVILLLVA